MFPLLGLFFAVTAIATSSGRTEIPISFYELPTYEARDDNEKDFPFDSIPEYSYEIQKGDNLSSIFDMLGYPYSDLMKVMEVDLNYLMLDTLKPGNKLMFWGSEDGKQLQRMVLEFNIADRVSYARQDDGGYAYENISIPGEWKLEPVVGEIYGNFSVSANKAGLGNSEIEQINTLLKDKLNFARDLRAGDTFEVVQSKQYVDSEATGKKEIQAIRIHNRGRQISAYLHTDGQFYDKDGNSLQRAFQRYPTRKRYRVSSSFNPRRRHPVTGRISPHNGTDFATPSGTPIYSTGDGKVVLTRNHPYAGKYIVIQHGSTYKTRYLHLSRILVKKGQKVSRGQKIALSGNTGRSTGPHLHYEFHIRGKPVNALKAKIPMANSVPKKELKAFKSKIAQYDKLLQNKLKDGLLAKN
ncbi:peptidoglycan DD-metalloendopeptidase family protein [Vibrio sp. JC009]|uniref:peptidoglycan DD-metalloendopeptidase family protein n=1 Tax=Vibrio sp. JC009 TaxID=2912314 RepID=UPI0023B06553|nr:peptidoglycan DD-metalloendopeptidase family protein [Vibrio sp. JC009]WED25009.1 peptidoglycan DD-metalloendopeptidase family protein [Vibrio sp. JC009]